MKIKKEITPQVLHQANLGISFSETFNYILPQWILDKAKQLVNGARKGVAMWDVMNDTKFNEDAGFIFRKLINDDYSLSVMGLFNIHRLGVGDEIGIYWDPRFQTFMFELLSMVCRKKIFSYKVNNTPSVLTRELIETGHAQTIHSNNMMYMRKKITSQDITFGELRISFFAMFDYILPYWKLELARSLVNRNVAHVSLWDVIEKKCGRTNRYEDVCRKKAFSNTPGVMTRELIETSPAGCRRLWISSFGTSEYILPYWELDKAKSLVNGNMERVGLWDVIEEKYGRTNRYEDVSFTFRKLGSLDYSLSCMTLINDRGLGVDGCIIVLERSYNTHLLPYWKLELARSLVNGNVAHVGLWDVTEKKCGRTNSGLGVGDEIVRFWDPRLPSFILRLVIQ
ncbi:hypothetical protein KY285_019565 [Solanum tuberosum]|nr:hypothetical protein KY285_019565 [Solanum tuberosum]